MEEKDDGLGAYPERVRQPAQAARSDDGSIASDDWALVRAVAIEGSLGKRTVAR